MRSLISCFAFLLFASTCLGFLGFKIFPRPFFKSPEELAQAKLEQNLKQNRAFREKLNTWISSSAPCCGEVLFDPQSNEMFQVEYTLDPEVQDYADRLLRTHRPDFGVVVVMNGENGDVLALSQFSQHPIEGRHLALRNSYPAASLFKVVTAAAAIEKAAFTPEQELLVTGSNSSLHRRHVLSPQPPRWARRMNLEEAFAQSVNSYFGLLAVHKVSPEDLLKYAQNFGFNRSLQSDFPLPESTTMVPSEPNFVSAQIGSGLNRISRISPVHAAMMGASLAHPSGELLAPNLVLRLRDASGELVYERKPYYLGSVISAASLKPMRSLMEATVRQGTSRKQFRSLLRNRRLAGVEFGGKTGSLTGDDPQGRSDWFVGYGIREDGSRIAVAALTVNEKFWRVKSSYLAQRVLGHHFGEEVGSRSAVATHSR